MPTKDEVQHNRIANKMEALHHQSVYAAFGFIAFWIVYGLVWVYFIGSWINVW